MVQGMRSYISGNERFRCEWVNNPYDKTKEITMVKKFGHQILITTKVSS